MKKLHILVGLISFVAIAAVAGHVAHAQSTPTGPNTPTGISAYLLSTQQVYITWNAATGTAAIDGYYLYRNGAFIASIPGYTYYTDTPGGGAFAYTVSSYDVNNAVSGQSNSSAAVTVVGDTTPPTTPTNLTAIPGATSVTLNWDASADDIGVIGYYVSRNGVRIQTQNPITGSSYQDTGLVAGVTYNYSVTAYDASRNVSGAAATQVKTIYDISPPTVPTNVVLKIISPTEIDLTWASSTDNTQVSGYYVFRNGVQIANAMTNSYADAALVSQNNYTYTVSAYDSVGNVSGYSYPPVSAVTPSPDFIVPSAPSGLIATALSPTEVFLSWRPATDNVSVAGYDVYRGGVLIGNTASTTYDDMGLATGTFYTYSVTAYDTSNNVGAQINQAVTTPDVAPTTPVLPPTTPPGVVPPPVVTPPTTTVPPVGTVRFTVNLSYGLTGYNVTTLQTFLIARGYLGASYATGFYGSLTQAAVRQLQCAQNIVCSGTPGTTGWGSVGPRTRNVLNSL